MASKAAELWLRTYHSHKDTVRVGQTALAKGTAYIYRVGSFAYEVAFAARILEQADSSTLMIQALELFARSVESGDCANRTDYPFNLARLHLEWYLGQWLQDGEPDVALLERSINLYAEALWQGEKRPLSTVAVLPPGYLLLKDGRRLEQFWQMLAKQIELERLPDELALWHRWSSLFLAGAADNGEFLAAYDTYIRKVKDPTTQPAKFYLSVAKIGLESFGLTGSRQDTLIRLAVQPWE